MKKKFESFFIIFGWMTLIGCASYQSKVKDARSDIEEGRYTEALEKLKPLAEKEGDDQLVYLLDYATVLSLTGQYKESNQAFLKADQLVDLNDFHSVSNIVGATLGGEEMIQYKGESYEKFLINTMLAINFAMMGELDSSLVEARRINEKISKMKMDGREPYDLSPFATYLSALLWEADRKFDDAYIAFERTYKLDGTISFLPKDLIRSAKNARRNDTYKKWLQEFPKVQENPDWYDRQKGELVILYQQGWAPRKGMQPGSYRFPKLYPVFSETQRARVSIDGVESCTTEDLYNIEQVAIQTLDRDYGALAARRVGGIVAKEVVADQIRQKNELLGLAAWVTMHLSDRADLRQWSMLPRMIQMCRIPLSAGEYKVDVLGLNGGAQPTVERKSFEKVRIESGRKTFLNWRSVR